MSDVPHDRLPDSRGYFGSFGGRFVPETLVPALTELADAYLRARGDETFQRRLQGYLQDFSGRPTPLYRADRLAAACGNARVRLYLKREDLNHTGAHKINNTLGQALLAVQMGKRNIIAETGAGQHGVATATAAAAMGLGCRVFMGTEDMRRQELNVFRMRLLGAEIHPVSAGTGTLKEAVSEAIRYWVTNIDDVYYVIGSVVGPDPYPRMVRDFQSVIGREAKEQLMQLEGQLPDALVACVGGGSNAIGLFHPFLNEPQVRMYGVEAAGKGLGSGSHAATLNAGRPGILHGALSYLLQDAYGQIQPAHSISAGLDYPGVGPEHSYLKQSGRAQYAAVTDEEALDAFQLLAECEGIIGALESAHAIAYLRRLLPEMQPGSRVVVCLSGRGDKDVAEVSRLLKARDGHEEESS